jgi:hypothetical protein
MDEKWDRTEHLLFKDEGLVSKDAITRWFTVYSRISNAELGVVRWFPNWRKYVFIPINSIFDWSCLREIADFSQAKTLAHRESRKAEREGKGEKARRTRRMEKLARVKIETYEKMFKDLKEENQGNPKEG